MLLVQADLWSVGAILYQLVVGKPPFDGNSQLQVVNRLNHDILFLLSMFLNILVMYFCSVLVFGNSYLSVIIISTVLFLQYHFSSAAFSKYIGIYRTALSTNDFKRATF